MEFIENEIQLQANYQLVMLKFLVNHKLANKAQIAEELAYYNNKDINNLDEIKKYFTVPVFHVLENRGFVKKQFNDGISEFVLNIELHQFQTDNVNNLLENKIRKYNSENNIPENEFDTTSIIDWSNDKSTIKTLELGIKIEPIKNTHKKNIDSISEKTLHSKIFIENNSEGLLIKKFQEISSEVLHKGQILSNDELMAIFGVGNMGGIRYSRKNNILILCRSMSEHYSDYIDEDSGFIKYTGEGQLGDQNFTGGNFRIANSKNIPILFFKEKSQEPGSKKRGALDNIYTFVGKVNYLKHFSVDESDKAGNQRKVFKFVLEVET